MGQLFDKPLSELREAFVRARFAEPAIFGRSDIEVWLEGQRVNLGNQVDPEPWSCDEFDEHMLAAWGDEVPLICEQVASLLREYVTPSASKPGWTEKDSATSRFVEVIETLRAGGAKVFYHSSAGQLIYDSWAIVVICGKAYCAVSKMDEGEDMIASLMRTNINDGMEFLLEEVMCGRPKAQQALEFLLVQYQSAIQSVRQSAQRDFDEAVAVSADGTEIVKAKWVVVGSDDEGWKGRAILYPAEAFHEQKILTSGQNPRESINMAHLGGLDYALEGEDLVMNLLQLLLRNASTRRGIWNRYLKDETGDGIFESLYLADFRSCPSPLPEGGREIRI